MLRRALPKLHDHPFDEGAVLGETVVGPLRRCLLLFTCWLLPFPLVRLRLTGSLWLLVRV
jgi:hypothetical protein